jgi:hypothetical protein
VPLGTDRTVIVRAALVAGETSWPPAAARASASPAYRRSTVTIAGLAVALARTWTPPVRSRVVDWRLLATLEPGDFQHRLNFEHHRPPSHHE